MKKVKLLGFVLLVVMGLAIHVRAGETSEDGRLIIKFSPALGMDVGLVMRVDGRTVAAVARGHVFEQNLAPGRHQLTVKRNGRRFEALHMTLNVRPGQTYSYVAKLPDDQIVLEPVGAPQ